MVKLWVYKVDSGLNTIDEVPGRYLEAVKKEMSIIQ